MPKKTKKKTGPATGTTKRPGRLARRKNLLAAVYQVISESGIDGASMRLIADRAKVSTGTINYHFGNKQKLIMAALHAAYDMAAGDAKAQASPFAQLKRQAVDHVFRSTGDRFWRFWINYTAAGTRKERLRKHQNDRFRQQLSSWKALIQDAMKLGEMRSDLNADDASEQLLIFAHGLVLRQLLQPDAKSRARCERLLEKHFKKLEAPSLGFTQPIPNGIGVF